MRLIIEVDIRRHDGTLAFPEDFPHETPDALIRATGEAVAKALPAIERSYTHRTAGRGLGRLRLRKVSIDAGPLASLETSSWDRS